MRRLTLAAASVLALAACKPGPSTVESARETGEIRLENASTEEVVRQNEAARGKHRIEPGQWENSYQLVSIDMPGLPEGPLREQMMAETKRPPRVVRECRKAADDKAIDFTKLSPTQQNCRFGKYVLAGGRIDATMECQGPFGPIRMSIAGTQSGAAYDVTMTQSTTAPGQTAQSKMTMRMTGKRVGDCKA